MKARGLIANTPMSPKPAPEPKESNAGAYLGNGWCIC